MHLGYIDDLAPISSEDNTTVLLPCLFWNHGKLDTIYHLVFEIILTLPSQMNLNHDGVRVFFILLYLDLVYYEKQLIPCYFPQVYELRTSTFHNLSNKQQQCVHRDDSHTTLFCMKLPMIVITLLNNKITGLQM